MRRVQIAHRRTQRRKLYHQDSPLAAAPDASDCSSAATVPPTLSLLQTMEPHHGCWTQDKGSVRFRIGTLSDEEGEEEEPPDEQKKTPAQPASAPHRVASLPSILGRGGFGSVFRAKFNRQPAAIKQLFRNAVQFPPSYSRAVAGRWCD